MQDDNNSYVLRRLLKAVDNDISAVVNVVSKPVMSSYSPNKPRVMVYVYVDLLEMAVAIDFNKKSIVFYNAANAPIVTQENNVGNFNFVTMVFLKNENK